MWRSFFSLIFAIRAKYLFLRPLVIEWAPKLHIYKAYSLYKHSPESGHRVKVVTGLKLVWP